MGWITDTGKVRRPTQIINEALRTYLDGKSTLRPAAALLDMDLEDLRAALEGDFDIFGVLPSTESPARFHRPGLTQHLSTLQFCT